MLGTHPLRGPLRGLTQRFHDWSVASQQQARRNAMVAATACAQRRVEREDVADFLDSRTRVAHDDAAPATSAGARNAARTSRG